MNRFAPYCEKMRNIYWEFKSLTVYWVDTIRDKTPDDPLEMIVDGRDAVTGISGEDVRNFVTTAGNFVTAMEQSGVLSAIQKPCVRHLEVN